jgi:hypothetical protein
VTYDDFRGVPIISRPHVLREKPATPVIAKKYSQNLQQPKFRVSQFISVIEFWAKNAEQRKTSFLANK